MPASQHPLLYVRLPGVLFLVVLFFAPRAIAQEEGPVTFTTEELADGAALLATNTGPAPVSVRFEWKLKNTILVEGDEVAVVPAGGAGVPVARLRTKRPRKPASWSFASYATFGDVTDEEYDEPHAYLLPFGAGESYELSQGYDGAFSHRGEYALDFAMPVGTVVTAIRGGVVTDVVERYRRRCPERRCAEYNNYVRVYHDDGTFATYEHLTHEGADVEVGQEIAAGDPIGRSGNTGWTRGPHLHLSVYLPGFRERRTVPVIFWTGEGEEAQRLVEGEVYARRS